MTPRAAGTAAIGALVALACVARLMFLDADPSIATWMGYVVDEGRWNQSARSYALFGSFGDTAMARLHLLVAPGYQAANVLPFKLLGIEFWSARALSAIAGIAVILAMVLALGRLVTPVALAIGVVLLGFEVNLLGASRMAIPEVPSVLGTLLAFLLLVLGRKTRWNAFASGVLAALAVVMKATTVLVIPVLPLILLCSPYEGRWSVRMVRAGAFIAGFGVWFVAGFGFALASGILDPGTLSLGNEVLNFLSLSGPYVAAMRFFDSTDLETRNVMLLGAWFCSWAWMNRDPRAPPRLVELYLASGAWAGWWLVVWSGGNYLPGRYVVHFVVPATIHIVAGISLLRPDLLTAMASGFSRRGIMRCASLAWLAFPTAIVLAAMSAGSLEPAGWDPSRLTVRGLSIAVWTGVLMLVAWRWRDRESVVAWFLAFPLASTLLYLAGREFGFFERFWQIAVGPEPVPAAWLAAGLAAAIALVVAVLAQRPPTGRTRGPLAWTVVVALATVLLLQSAPALMTPTYSIRSASRDIGRQIAPSMQVRTLGAESLFLANTVRFRTLQPDDRNYDALVIFEHGALSKRFLTKGGADALERIATYPVARHRRYPTQEELYGPASIALFVKP